MRTVALYARVSSDQQAQEATIDSQLAALQKRADADGHVVAPQDVYADEGFSGASLLRPQLERLRDRIAEGLVEVVYVHSPDRLARKYAYQVLLLDEFHKHGVTTIFLQAPSGKTAEDELLVQVQGMIAEYERAKILERSRRGKLHRARQGAVSVLGSAPYGFLYLKKSEQVPASYQILLPEAKVVRRVFHALVNEQKSLGQIGRDLDADKIPTPGGAKRWNRGTLRNIVTNRAYAGKAAFCKSEVIERQTPVRPRRGAPTIPRSNTTQRLRPKNEWITIDVPAIISEQLFEAAQEQLARNRKLSPRNGRGRHLLQGLTVCAHCARPDPDNIARLRNALKQVWNDPDIDQITAEDLCGDYPAVRYGPPQGTLYLDIITRLGEATAFADLNVEVKHAQGIPVRIATPDTLYRMKKDTVRPIDHSDAHALRVAFKLGEE